MSLGSKDTIDYLLLVMEENAKRFSGEAQSFVSEMSRRIKTAWELAQIDLRQEDALMLLETYATAPDEKLTDSAKQLKHRLLEIAKNAKEGQSNEPHA